MNKNIVLIGDAVGHLKTMSSESIDCCVTSPPYFGLRDYGVPDQIGLETSVEAYVSKLVEVFSEVKRVLKKDGTLWLNIGDSYVSSPSGSRGNSEKAKAYGFGDKHKHACASSMHTDKTKMGIPVKNLIGIPWKIAFALQSDGWILRQDIIWYKPNPMPESVKDRFTRSHEYIFFFTKSKKYKFNQIKEKCVYEKYGEFKNKRDVWSISVQPSNGSHVAPFPSVLAEHCIAAGSNKSDIVLDPFLGSGTTAVVAKRMERNYIGIELNAEYASFATDRINKA